MQETLVQSLGWEDPLEEGVAIHSSILAWRIPWTEEPGGLQSMGSQKVEHNWTNFHFPIILKIEESEIVSLIKHYFSFKTHIHTMWDK